MLEGVETKRTFISSSECERERGSDKYDYREISQTSIGLGLGGPHTLSLQDKHQGNLHLQSL